MIEFICPRCRLALDRNQIGLKCPSCSVTWPVRDDIPDFRDKDFYWNQLTRETMISMIENARAGCWKMEVQRILGNSRPYLLDYIVKEGRADWMFYMPIPRSASVLDIGTGWGAVTIELAKKFETVVAADPTLETLSFLRIRAMQEGVRNIIPIAINPLDVPSFPFVENCFDLIVLNGVLEWVGSYIADISPNALQYHALRVIRAALKSTGYLYIGIENRFYFKSFLGSAPHGELPFIGILPRRIADWISKALTGKAHRTYIYSLGGLRKLLKKSGFKVVQVLLPLPSYHFPRTIIPLELFDYWRDHFMSPNSFKKRVFKALRVPRLAMALFCHSYGLIAKKE